MGGRPQRPDLINEQYRAMRLSNLFATDPTTQALLASLSRGATGPNALGQLFQGAGGPTVDMGVLPPELQVRAAVPQGQAPTTSTLPPNLQAQATSGQPQAPAGSAITVSPQAAAAIAVLQAMAQAAPSAPAGEPKGPGGELPGGEKGRENAVSSEVEAGQSTGTTTQVA